MNRPPLQQSSVPSQQPAPQQQQLMQQQLQQLQQLQHLQQLQQLQQQRLQQQYLPQAAQQPQSVHHNLLQQLQQSSTQQPTSSVHQNLLQQLQQLQKLQQQLHSSTAQQPPQITPEQQRQHLLAQQLQRILPQQQQQQQQQQQNPQLQVLLPQQRQQLLQELKMQLLVAQKHMADSGQHRQGASPILGLGSCSVHEGIALADFNGATYGPEFISASKGDTLLMLSSPEISESEGWIVGHVQKDGSTGIFPASYWAAKTPNPTPLLGPLQVPTEPPSQNQFNLVQQSQPHQMPVEVAAALEPMGLPTTQESQAPIGLAQQQQHVAMLQQQLQQLQQLQQKQQEKIELLKLQSSQEQFEAPQSSTYPGRSGVALADFDAARYGSEFISLKAGEGLTNLSLRDDGGWSCGIRHRDLARGWFPTEYFSAAEPATGSKSIRANPVQAEATSTSVVAPEKKGLIQVGTTTFEGQQKLVKAHRALENSTDVASVTKTQQPESGHLLSDFDGTTYGPEFLTLKAFEAVTLISARNEEGWSFGIRQRDNARGWFPSEYFASQRKPSSHVIPLAQKALPSSSPASHEDLITPLTSDAKVAETANILPVAKTVLEEKQILGLFKVLQASGGRAVLGNLSAAILALGIMHGPHQHVYRDVIGVVQTRSDLFEQLPKYWKHTALKELTVALRPEVIAGLRSLGKQPTAEAAGPIEHVGSVLDL